MASSTKRSTARTLLRRLHPGRAQSWSPIVRAHGRLGDVRRNEYVCRGALLGLGAAREMGRERASPRYEPAPAERHVRRHVRHLLRPAQRLHVLHEPARRAGRLLGRRRRAVEHRLESGLERADRAIRGGLDRRDGDSVQDASLPIGPGPGLGHPAAPVDPPEERVDVLDARPAVSRRSAGAQPDLRGRHAGRPRSPAGEPEPRAQAVRDLADDDRPRAESARLRTISTATSAAT